jgi:hypothetical protein
LGSTPLNAEFTSVRTSPLVEVEKTGNVFWVPTVGQPVLDGGRPEVGFLDLVREECALGLFRADAGEGAVDLDGIVALPLPNLRGRFIPTAWGFTFWNSRIVI